MPVSVAASDWSSFVSPDLHVSPVHEGIYKLSAVEFFSFFVHVMLSVLDTMPYFIINVFDSNS